ncbi:MAG TPA: hypothetical protein VL172_14780 [Kofleriaceae bacterium]|nr:hypothetical protein [Kofleriaceae bacterium]
MKILLGALALAALQPPAGWTEQPGVAEHAWGDPAMGVFGVVISQPSEPRLGARDAIAGFRDAAAAAGIELGEPTVHGPELVAPIRRGRWRGTARLRAGEHALELAACFFTERRPEQAERDCAAFLAAAEEAR